jgi:hypothetical protein
MNQPYDPRNPGPWPGQHGGPQQGPWPGQQGGPQQGPWPGQQGGPQQGPWPGQHGGPQQGPWPGQHGGPPQGPWPGQQGGPQQGPWPGQHGGPQQVPWPGQPAPPPHPGAHPWPGQHGHGAPWVPQGQQPHPWPAGMYVPRVQHEFTPEENEILADLARWSGALGILKLLQAGMGFLGKNLLGGAIELAVGLSLLGARKSLRSAVDTEGNDIDHLLIAVEKLTTVFTFRLILSLFGVGVVVLVVGIVFLMMLAGEPIDLDELF